MKNILILVIKTTWFFLGSLEQQVRINSMCLKTIACHEVACIEIDAA